MKVIKEKNKSTKFQSISFSYIVRKKISLFVHVKFTSISLALKTISNCIVTDRIKTMMLKQLINRMHGFLEAILKTKTRAKPHRPIISTRNKPFQPASPSPVVSAHQVAFPLLRSFRWKNISRSFPPVVLPAWPPPSLFLRIITESCNSSSGGRAFF